MKYDLFYFHKVIQEGYASKVTKVEKALAKIDESLKPIAVHDHFVFTVNESTHDLIRFQYVIEGNTVRFSSPAAFSVSDDRKAFDAKEGKIVNNIIEALAEEDVTRVDELKREYFDLTRESIRLQGILESDLTSTPTELVTARKLIAPIIESDEKVAKLISQLPQNEYAYQLAESGAVSVNLYSQPSYVKPISEKELVQRQIIEARHEAKKLDESIAFSDAIVSIERYQDEAEDYLTVFENFQEYYCLTLDEQIGLLNKVYANAKIDVSEQRVFEINRTLLRLAELKMPQDVLKMFEMIDSDGENFNDAMKLVEEKLNKTVYSADDVNAVNNILKKVLSSGNDILAPEMGKKLQDAKVLLGKMSADNIDDGALASVLSMLSQFAPAFSAKSVKPVKESIGHEKSDQPKDQYFTEPVADVKETGAGNGDSKEIGKGKAMSDTGAEKEPKEDGFEDAPAVKTEGDGKEIGKGKTIGHNESDQPKESWSEPVPDVKDTGAGNGDSKEIGKGKSMSDTGAEKEPKEPGFEDAPDVKAEGAGKEIGKGKSGPDARKDHRQGKPPKGYDMSAPAPSGKGKTIGHNDSDQPKESWAEDVPDVKDTGAGNGDSKEIGKGKGNDFTPKMGWRVKDLNAAKLANKEKPEPIEVKPQPKN